MFIFSLSVITPLWSTRKAKSSTKQNIIIILTRVFTLYLNGGLSYILEWQNVLLNLQDSSEYSGSYLYCCRVNCLDSSSSLSFSRHFSKHLGTVRNALNTKRNRTKLTFVQRHTREVCVCIAAYKQWSDPVVKSPWENLMNTQKSVLVHQHKSLFATTLLKYLSTERNSVCKLSHSRYLDKEKSHVMRRKGAETDLEFFYWVVCWSSKVLVRRALLHRLCCIAT